MNTDYNPEADPMPAGMIDRLLNAVHAELDLQR